MLEQINLNWIYKRFVTHIVSLRLGLVLVVLAHILDGVGRAYDLRWSVLPFGRPHCEACEKAAVGDFEFGESVRHIAAVRALLLAIAVIASVTEFYLVKASRPLTMALAFIFEETTSFIPWYTRVLTKLTTDFLAKEMTRVRPRSFCRRDIVYHRSMFM